MDLEDLRATTNKTRNACRGIIRSKAGGDGLTKDLTKYANE